jgi:hypothetical protein
MPELIVPYQGGQVVVSEEAQAAAKAAQEWSHLDSGLTSALTKRGVNNLDPDTQRRLNELRQRMRTSPPKPATVINLHPWSLTFGSNSIFLRGITIPACEPGMPYAYHHIRGYRADKYPREDGTSDFVPIMPIELAAQFVREFSTKETYGGGVIIYEGESHPDKIDLVETYDPIGRLNVTQKHVTEYDEENRPVTVVAEVPIKRKLASIIDEQRKARNAFYFASVQKADHDYKLPDGRGKWLITPNHQSMAQMLFAEGVIPVVPEWNLSSRLEQGLSENNCPACGNSPREGSFKCASCGHILNAFAAYKAGAIEWGHVSMDTMSSDEWEEAEETKTAREMARFDAQARRSSGTKAEKPDKGKK